MSNREAIRECEPSNAWVVLLRHGEDNLPDLLHFERRCEQIHWVVSIGEEVYIF